MHAIATSYSEQPSVYDPDSVWLIVAKDAGTVNDDHMRIAQTCDGAVLMFHLRTTMGTFWVVVWGESATARAAW